MARANLAIALLNQQKHEEARAEAWAAATLLPDRPHPLYVWALAARGLADAADAEAAFRRVVALDPQDVGARVNLGQILMQARKYPEAIEQFQTAVTAEEHNATAHYNLGQALIRAGQAEEAQRTMERFRELREAGYGTFLGQTYPEQGRYAEALVPTGLEPRLVDATRPKVQFARTGSRWLPGARPRTGRVGAILLADLDGDGDLDLLDVGTDGQSLLVNDGKAFADGTARWGLEPKTGGTGAVAGDVDNDGRPDLLVLSARGVRLLKNGGAAFTDITAAAGLPADVTAAAAALVDADHDGDLDVLLGGRLFQNDGSPKFKEVTQASGLAAPPDLTAVVPTDFDERRDVDLLLASGTAAPRLFQNRRNGTFRDVAAERGLGDLGGATAVAAADVDKNGFADFFFGRAEGPGVLALADGKGGFTHQPVPNTPAGARRALFLDYDNDGLLDLVVLAGRGPRLLRNLGGKGWDDVSGDAAMPIIDGDPPPSALAAGDLDGDGDTDLVLRLPGGLEVLENKGSKNRSLRVSLAGVVSNRSGVGAKVEMRSGSLRQKLETSAATPPVAPADLVFGLGPRAGVDAVRVLWPAGVLQTEMPEAGPRLAIKELDRKPSSCPYLYAWNGQRFTFVTDFMGGGEMGYWLGPGQYNHPDPDEYVRLTDGQLRPRDGRLELRVTNELEEALFVDRLSLLAVDHPAQVEIHPDEALRHVAPGFRLVAVSEGRPLRAAQDGHGRDVHDRLTSLDRRFADGFGLHRIRGYAEEHALILDLGPQAGEDAVLLLTGWTDYAFSKDNVAAHQAGLAMQPPRLEVETAAGEWATVVEDVGIPVGRPQTVLVEMKGRWRGPSRRVRIVTNMRIYWDQARVGTATSLPGPPARLEAMRADLRERGFSAEVTPDGREPFTYDYQRVGWASPWKAFPGRYTRVGDVRELLSATDDVFVLSRPGDEIALSFDATGLPPLPAGWRRTYLLHADGYSKEMDLHSATPDQLGPLPYHAMPAYPYAPPAAYPMTPERQALMDAYTTRVVAAPVPTLELALVQEPPK